WGNTIGTGGYNAKNYPFSVAGQANCVRDVIDTIAHTKNGIGVCYWEGAWISVGDTTNGATTEANRVLWEKYGSGWASSYAASYDPNDAGQFYGGCAVDNQAFFDPSGHPYESLKVFNLAHFGNTNVPEYIDGIEDAELIKYNTDNFTLPETVNVVLNTNEKKPVKVTWEKWLDTEVKTVEEAKNLGNGKYTIEGHAEGFSTPVYCYLTIMEYNYIENYSFETGTAAPWERTINAGTADTETHKILVTNENPNTGKYSYHFWSNDQGGANFDLTQSIKTTTYGYYKLQGSYLGGDATSEAVDEATQNNYIYVKINGTIAFQQSYAFTKYNDGFKDVKLTGIEIHEGDTVVVGFHVECSVKGVWGAIDDVMLNFVSGF
ncbi:MAG: glycosyl hydrolase 53 family protein, partial [Bacilli bacterium]|nr:glycosyl hydrolase 53 family protein [Bacilli bacterium]